MQRLLLVLLFVARSVHADPAHDHFTRGKELAVAGKYADALAELEQGYALSGRPLFVFNMAECARALGDAPKARTLYERYLAADPSGAFVAKARERLAELPPPPVVVPPPAQVAAAIPPPLPPPPRPPASHWRRNALLAGLGVAVIAGSVAIYAGTRAAVCGAGCVDLRH